MDIHRSSGVCGSVETGLHKLLSLGGVDKVQEDTNCVLAMSQKQNQNCALVFFVFVHCMILRHVIPRTSGRGPAGDAIAADVNCTGWIGSCYLSRYQRHYFDTALAANLSVFRSSQASNS